MSHALWCDVGDNGENECVTQQELAAVKEEIIGYKFESPDAFREYHTNQRSI